MEIVNVQLARTIWLFDTQELNPKGVSLYPEIFNGFARRYQFAVCPKPEEIQSGGSLHFKQGKFVYDSLPVEVDFDLHSDGLVASCRHSTDAADQFLMDVVAWLGERLGIVYPPRVNKKRGYRSELIVQVDARLGDLSTKAQLFSGLLSQMSGRPVQPVGILFGQDGSAAPTLTVERRINTPWEENRYFSGSNLPTLQHVEALTQFERIMVE